MSMVLQLHMIQDADSDGKEKQEVFAIFDDTDFGNDEEAEQRRKVCDDRTSRGCVSLFALAFFYFRFLSSLTLVSFRPYFYPSIHLPISHSCLLVLPASAPA